MNGSYKFIKMLTAACVITAIIFAGEGLLNVLRDTVGYIIYLSVFAVPVVYFYKKREKDMN